MKYLQFYNHVHHRNVSSGYPHLFTFDMLTYLFRLCAFLIALLFHKICYRYIFVINFLMKRILLNESYLDNNRFLTSNNLNPQKAFLGITTGDFCILRLS